MSPLHKAAPPGGVPPPLHLGSRTHQGLRLLAAWTLVLLLTVPLKVCAGCLGSHQVGMFYSWYQCMEFAILQVKPAFGDDETSCAASFLWWQQTLSAQETLWDIVKDCSANIK